MSKRTVVPKHTGRAEESTSSGISKRNGNPNENMTYKQVEKMVFTNPLVKQTSAKTKEMELRMMGLEKGMATILSKLEKEKARRSKMKDVLAKMLIEQDGEVADLGKKVATIEMQLFKIRKKNNMKKKREQLENLEDEDSDVPVEIDIEAVGGKQESSGDDVSAGTTTNDKAGGGDESSKVNPGGRKRKRPRKSDVTGVETVHVEHVGEVNVASLFGSTWQDEEEEEEEEEESV